MDSLYDGTDFNHLFLDSKTGTQFFVEEPALEVETININSDLEQKIIELNQRLAKSLDSELEFQDLRQNQIRLAEENTILKSQIGGTSVANKGVNRIAPVKKYDVEDLNEHLKSKCFQAKNLINEAMLEFEREKSEITDIVNHELKVMSQALAEEKAMSLKLAGELQNNQMALENELCLKEDLQQKNGDLHTKVKKYKDAFDALFETKIANGQEQAKLLKNQNELTERLNKLQDECILKEYRLQEEIALRAKSEQQFNETRTYQLEAQAKSANLASLQDQNEFLAKEKRQLQQELNEKMFLLQTLEKTVSNQAFVENELKLEIFSLKNENLQKEKRAAEELSSKNEYHQMLTRQIQLLKEAGERDKGKANQLTESLFHKELELNKLRSVEENFKQEISQLKNELANGQGELAQSRKVSSEAQLALATYRERIFTSNSELNNLNNKVAGLLNENSALKEQLTLVVLQNKEQLAALELQTEEKLAVCDLQNKELLVDLNNKTISFDSEKEQIQKWVNQLNNRELQIRQYVKHLDTKRDELKTHIQKFTAELSVSTALHPLKDYLRFTEYQVEQMELQFKKTPVLSANRAELENQLEKMIEQKNFLKAITVSSKDQIELQSQELVKLLQIDPPVVLPPMPLRKIT